MPLSPTDRLIINSLQGGFPVCENPWHQLATQLSIDEDQLIERIQRMQHEGYISRFGPLYDAQQLGGGLSLAAMRVDAADFEAVADIVNRFKEVAHNYERDHVLNMWFVIATEFPWQVEQVITQIEQRTGLRVYNMPKQDEYFLGLRLEV